MLASIVKSKVITQRSSALESGNLGIASPILPRLYLSGYAVASNEVRITALGVTHVLSVMQLVAPEYEGAIKTMLVDIEDTAQSDLLQHLDATTAFIKDALEENDTNIVLVCISFKSIVVVNSCVRSGSLCDGGVALGDRRLRVLGRHNIDDATRSPRVRYGETTSGLSQPRLPKAVGNVFTTFPTSTA